MKSEKAGKRESVVQCEPEHVEPADKKQDDREFMVGGTINRSLAELHSKNARNGRHHLDVLLEVTHPRGLAQEEEEAEWASRQQSDALASVLFSCTFTVYRA